MSIEPLAMYWPLGSKRAAKISPEWPGKCQHNVNSSVLCHYSPLSSITCACSPALLYAYAFHQISSNPLQTCSAQRYMRGNGRQRGTYSLYERSPGAICSCKCTAIDIGIRLLPLHQLCAAKRGRCWSLFA